MSRVAVAAIKMARPLVPSRLEQTWTSLRVFLPELIFAVVMVAAAFGLRVAAFWL